MKLLAETNGEKYEIEIVRDTDRVFAIIDGRKYELEATEPEPNIFVFKLGSSIHQVFISPQINPADPFEVQIENTGFDILLTDPKRLRSAGQISDHGGGLAEIKTAMPGKVVRILVAQGDTVEKGGGIIVVEAMKMQNEMKSPKDGIVSEIRFAEGDTVAAGDVLAIIE